ncbi:MAG: relaxase/mobilization nuclease domain-containing protein, partial [Actinomycetota bacterium]|nr:relaxase/mobilization nuclease domain-containing protein [Actinomycetota bacterium]
MIGKVVWGSRVGGLIRYLFGPGRANEHVDPRVVGAWVDPGALEPSTTARGQRDYRPLISRLERPLAVAGLAAKSVWHCSLRSAPGDRALSDTEWADIAGEVMDRTQLASPGDDGGCRWVAVRHAEDHVHLVATLARQDGRPAVLARNDFYRVGEACRAVEERYGLAITAGRDRTAAVRPTRAESEKAERLAKPAIAREVLRLEVQTAASGPSGEEEFFARLEVAGVMVGKRYSERNPGQVTGYRVALPGSMAGSTASTGSPSGTGAPSSPPTCPCPSCGPTGRPALARWLG